MRSLILSAGFGKRLLPHTQVRAKPAIPLLGIPSLCYPLFLAESLGLTDLTFNLHHLPETVEEAALKFVSNDYKTHFTKELPKILDSAGGMKNAQEFLIGDGHFSTFNGDSLTLFESLSSLKKAWEVHLNSSPLCTLLVQEHTSAGTSHGGVFVDPKTNLVDHFARKKVKDDLKACHYLGMAFFRDDIFEWIPENQPHNILYDTLTNAIAKGKKVEVFNLPEVTWYETGNSQDFLKASTQLIEHLESESKYVHFLQKIYDRFCPKWNIETLKENLSPFETLSFE